MELLDTDWVIQALAQRQPALGTLDRLAGSRVYVSYVTLGAGRGAGAGRGGDGSGGHPARGGRASCAHARAQRAAQRLPGAQLGHAGGAIALRVPRVRGGSSFPSLFAPRTRGERALVVVQEANAGGVSTRRVDEPSSAICLEALLSSSLNRMSAATYLEAALVADRHPDRRNR